MTVMLLSLFVITFIQLTSSQPTSDVTLHVQDNDVTSCRGREKVLSELVAERLDHLMTAVSLLEQKIEALGGNKDSCKNATAKGNVT